jgi:hypothetical protein
MSHRSHGTYSIEQIAGALFALSGRVPGALLPPGFASGGGGARFGADHGPPDAAPST